MNRPDDLYRELGDWLSDGPTVVADRVIEGALDTIQQTPQRRRQRVPWRFPDMPFANRLALVAMLILATVGTTLVVSTGTSPSPAGPRTIIVAQDGSGDFTTITEAVAIAQDGETVLVRPGTYAESVAITEDITLRGDGARGTVVLEFSADGPTHTWSPSGTFVYGVLLEGSDARVENLTVRGPAEGGAFVIDGGAPVIEGVDIILDGDIWGGPSGQYYKRSAFRIQGGSSPVIRGSAWDGYTNLWGADAPTFEGNVVTTQYISIPGGSSPVIRGNTLLDGAGISWTDAGSSGIAENNDIVGYIGVAGGSDPTIRGNRITKGTEGQEGAEAYHGAGIRLLGSGTSIVEGNEITDSPYGIEVSGVGATPEIRGNIIRGSSSVAIIVENGAAPTVDGNVIEGNATGIEVIGTSTPVMTGNTLCENQTNLTVPDGSTLTLAGNTICGNGTHLTVPDGSTLTLAGNTVCGAAVSAAP